MIKIVLLKKNQVVIDKQELEDLVYDLIREQIRPIEQAHITLKSDLYSFQTSVNKKVNDYLSTENILDSIVTRLKNKQL